MRPITHLHLVPRIRLGEAVSSPPICLHGMYRDNLILHLRCSERYTSLKGINEILCVSAAFFNRVEWNRVQKISTHGQNTWNCVCFDTIPSAPILTELGNTLHYCGQISYIEFLKYRAMNVAITDRFALTLRSKEWLSFRRVSRNS